MAGSSNLYLEPIINGAVGDMGTNIAAMNTQLSETTRILMNILNNQGLEQRQAAYGGATFSALTLSSAPAKNIVAFVNDNNTIAFGGSNTVSLSVKIPANNPGGVDFLNIDLTGANTIKFVPFATIGTGDKWHIAISSGGVVYDHEIDAVLNTEYVYTLSETEKAKADFVRIYIEVAGTARNFAIYDAKIDDTLIPWLETPALVFSAANLLAYGTTTSQYFTKSYTETTTAFITIPDIQGVATWVSTILKGNLDGVSLALVDNTTHELIKVLPTATSDISDVQQLSGLALMVTFAGDGNGLKYMSGFSMRYY